MSTRDADAPLSNSLSFLLSQLGAQRASAFAQGTSEAGLTPRGFAILTTLASEQAPTQQQLSEKLGIHRNNMVTLIDGLEAAGYVTRVRDSADRRAFRIHRTQAGTEAANRVNAVIDEMDTQLSRSIGANEAEALRRTLKTLTISLGLEPGIHPSMRER